MRRRKPANPAPQVEHREFGHGVVINRFQLSGDDGGKVLTVRFGGGRGRVVLLLPQYWTTGWEGLLAAFDAAPDRATQKTKKSAGVSDPRPETGQPEEASVEVDETNEAEIRASRNRQPVA